MDKRILNQINLLKEINAKSGINVVTCPECECVILQRIEKEEQECPFCRFTGDVKEFESLYIDGMENVEL